MKKEELFDLLHIEDLMDLPDAIMKILEGDIDVRNNIYNRLLEISYFDMSIDWFQKLYEEELAQRSKNKQDFTPNSVSKIVSLLTGNKSGWIYEPTAGNGSMIISDWWNRCQNSSFPIMHFPSQNMVNCWELSSRSIPILLLNLSIRGIMGYVFHGDVITQEIKCKYILLNKNDNTLGFSDIIKDPNNEIWIEEKGSKDFYKPLKYP